MQPYFSLMEMETIAWRLGTFINFRSNDAYLRAEFNKWDDNGNGILERNEVEKMMTGLFNQNVGEAVGGQGGNKQALEYLFARFAEKGSQGFTFDQFKDVSYYSLKVLGKQQLQQRFGTSDFTPLLTRYKEFVINFFNHCTQEFIYQQLNTQMQGLNDEQQYNKISELCNVGYNAAGTNALADYVFMYSIVAIASQDWIGECFDIGASYQKIWYLPDIIDQTIVSLQGN